MAVAPGWPEPGIDVEVAGRRYRVTLREGRAVAVAAWIVERFGSRAPHAYWRLLWTARRREPGRLVRMVIAEALIAASREERGMS